MIVLRWIAEFFRASWRFIHHVFDGTKEAHAKVDRAVRRAETVCRQVEEMSAAEH